MLHSKGAVNMPYKEIIMNAPTGHNCCVWQSEGDNFDANFITLDGFNGCTGGIIIEYTEIMFPEKMIQARRVMH